MSGDVTSSRFQSAVYANFIIFILSVSHRVDIYKEQKLGPGDMTKYIVSRYTDMFMIHTVCITIYRLPNGHIANKSMALYIYINHNTYDNANKI